MKFAAPRILNAPPFCMFSHLKKTFAPASRSKLCEFSTGVRRAIGFMRWAAARMSSMVTEVAIVGGIASLSITWPTGSVPDVCTCGAVLPPDARFCHKCGKPQRDEPLFIQEEAPIQRPIEPPGLPPLSQLELPRIGFHNGLAVRVALLAGVLAFFCSIITGQLALPQEFALVWLVAGGFFAVYLYERRTGKRLSVRSGARLGWICGVFGFVVVTIALAATAVMLSDP